MSEYLVSIVIPVYNVEKYLEECMSSIQGVDINIVEIILVNDGSTDSSSELCQKYADMLENVKYIEQKNQGLSEARNTGIKNATGQYILFLDSDDYLYTDNLLQVIKIISKNKGEDFFIGRAYEFEDGTSKHKLCQIDYSQITSHRPEEAFVKLDNINDFWFAAWLIIIKRDFLVKNNLYFKKGIYHEDELWVPSVFAKAQSFEFINVGFYCYRLNRRGSIISTHNIKREFDKIIIIDEFDKLSVDSLAQRKMLKKRQAALLYGIILKLNLFSDSNEYKILIDQINHRINKLLEGKYIFVFVLYKLMGGIKLSKILSK